MRIFSNNLLSVHFPTSFQHWNWESEIVGVTYHHKYNWLRWPRPAHACAVSLETVPLHRSYTSRAAPLQQAPFVHLRVLAQCWSRPSSRTTIVSDIQLVFSSLQPVELYQCTGDRPRITLVTYQLYSNSPREQWSESSSDFIFSNMLRFAAVVASSMVRRYYGDTEWERRVKISKLLRANETTRRHPVTVAAPQQICKIFGEPRPVAFKSSQPSWSRITVTKQNKRDLSKLCRHQIPINTVANITTATIQLDCQWGLFKWINWTIYY